MRRVHDWSGVVQCLKRDADGILAYFDDRKSSGVIEGFNNKARVIQKRCYGLKMIDTSVLVGTGADLVQTLFHPLAAPRARRPSDFGCWHSRTC